MQLYEINTFAIAVPRCNNRNSTNEHVARILYANIYTFSPCCPWIWWLQLFLRTNTSFDFPRIYCVSQWCRILFLFLHDFAFGKMSFSWQYQFRRKSREEKHAAKCSIVLHFFFYFCQFSKHASENVSPTSKPILLCNISISVTFNTN